MSASNGPPSPADEQPPVPPAAFVRYKVADPRPFTGDKTKYRAFTRSLDQCFRADPEKFPPILAESRILFTLSYMQEGLAEEWANHFYDAAMNQGLLPTWTEFQTLLDASFVDANVVNTA
jgi:hypothetical protein